MCSFCDIQNAAPINIFSDEEIERIVIGVYSGLITPQSLDVAFRELNSTTKYVKW